MHLYGKLIIPVFRLMTQNDKGINVLQRMELFLAIFNFQKCMILKAKVSRWQAIDFAKKVNCSQQLRMRNEILNLYPIYSLLGATNSFHTVNCSQ